MKTSRRDLLEWFNSLNIQIDRIEDLGKGVAICKLLAQIHPDYKFPYIKTPSSKYEYLKNLKIVQNFFFENNIRVKFMIDKLVECKLQDNLEFAQWLYKYYVKNLSKNKDNADLSQDNHTNDINIEYLGNETAVGDLSSLNDTKYISHTNELSSEIIREVREKNRQDILDNLRMHKSSASLVNENMKLKEEIRMKDKEIEELKVKLGVFANNEISTLIKELEDNRDFYFMILVELEKYLNESSCIESNVKQDLLDILYKKQ